MHDDPAAHRPLATRFGQDAGVSILCHRSMALWLLGYPAAALTDAKQALQEARDIGQATNLLFALFFTSLTQIFCGNYTTATKEHDELIALVDEIESSLYLEGALHPDARLSFCADGQSLPRSPKDRLGHCRIAVSWNGILDAVALVISWGQRLRSLANLTTLGAASAKPLTTIETTKETWFEAEANRIAGEIALQSPKPDATKAQKYFECALAVSQKQQAKSWELRVADQPRAPLARPGQSAASARTACSGVRVVHGGVRHARSEGSEGVAGGIGGLSNFRNGTTPTKPSTCSAPSAACSARGSSSRWRAALHIRWQEFPGSN